MKKKLILTSMLFASVLALSACGSSTTNNTKTETSKTEQSSTSAAAAELKDGTYTAETGYDERGYKVVHTITVSGGKVTESKFGYQKEDGSWKADDEEYNKMMEEKSGISSKDATAKLDAQLVEKQSADVDVVTGATTSSNNFKLTAEALLKAAAEGNTETVTVELAH